MPIAMPMDNVSPLSVQALDDPQEQAGFTRWQTNARGDREAVSQLRISGMYCAACAGVIESALHAIPGVLEARVSASSERAQVRWDPQRTQLSALVLGVRQAGYGALPDVACAAQAQRQRELRLALWRLFVACFCMMQVMMYATPAYLAEPGDIGADSLRLLQWASWLLSLPVLLFSAGPFFKGAWNSLRAAAHRHGRACRARHRRHLRGQHRSNVRSHRRVRARGLLRLADDVRLLPPRRAMARTARTAQGGRRARGRTRTSSRQRGAPARRWPQRKRGAVAPAARRSRASHGGPGLSGRRRAARGPDARR